MENQKNQPSNAEHPDHESNATPRTDGGSPEVRRGKEGAVEQWRSVLDDLDGDTEDEQFILEADIHDSEDRREIEEIIDNGDVSNGLALEDAFHDLQEAFQDVW